MTRFQTVKFATTNLFGAMVGVFEQFTIQFHCERLAHIMRLCSKDNRRYAHASGNGLNRRHIVAM